MNFAACLLGTGSPRSSQQGVAGDGVDGDLGPVVVFARTAVSDASLPICFDDVEELIVDSAHVLFADAGDCRWAEPGAGAGRNGGF